MSSLLPDSLGAAADTVSPKNILFIGGTGVISASAAERAVALGHRLTILNRGRSAGRPVGRWALGPVHLAGVREQLALAMGS